MCIPRPRKSRLQPILGAPPSQDLIATLFDGLLHVNYSVLFSRHKIASYNECGTNAFTKGSPGMCCGRLMWKCRSGQWQSTLSKSIVPSVGAPPKNEGLWIFYVGIRSSCTIHVKITWSLFEPAIASFAALFQEMTWSRLEHEYEGALPPQMDYAT